MSLSNAIDPSAVARGVGIKSTFKNLRRNSVALLPQRIAIFGQGNDASVYSSDKRRITSALEAGQVYGFGSPIHLAALQLLPNNGDGVGLIPVTVYPLADGTTPASGAILPSGTQVTGAAYRVTANGIATQEFVIAAGDSVTRMARSIYTAIAATLGFPANATYTYGTVTSTAGTNTGNGTVTALSVTGTPTPGTYVLKCKTAVADGGVFTLTDPDGTVLTPDITLTPGAGGATVVTKAGLQFTVTDGSTDFAPNDSFNIIVPATTVNLVTKWSGASANSVKLTVEGSTTAGVTFTITQPVGGLGDPSITPALDAVGNVWETMGLNCLDITNSTALDAIETWGVGRWGALTKKPIVVFTGNTLADVNAAIAVSDARKSNFTNAQLVNPGSVNLPFVVAARELARIAYVANSNPPQDYGSQRATGLVGGSDALQWDYTERNLAVTSGSSTVEINDGVVYLGDTVTFYHPTGDLTPAYRYVCDIVKLQNIIFNLDAIFKAPEWDGAPLIPDDQPTSNRSAKKPRMAVAAVCSLLDLLGLAAIISDPETAKKNVVAEIDENNPKRLNLVLTVQLSGNSNIKSIDLDFGFYFGTPGIVN